MAVSATTLVSESFKTGDLITSSFKGTPVYRVMDPPFTPQGKLRLARKDEPDRVIKRTWWTSEDDLPQRWHLVRPREDTLDGE